MTKLPAEGAPEGLTGEKPANDQGRQLAAALRPAAVAPLRWSKVLGPERRAFDIPWRELWAYRYLIFLLVQRDITTTYKQTVLGPALFFLQPFVTTVVFTLVFGNLANVPTDGVPSFLFFMSGVILWTFFASCLTRTATTFTTNGSLFSKVYFPRLALPISVVLNSLVTFALQFVFLLGFFIYFWSRGAALDPNWRLLILPLLLFQMSALALGLGCAVAAFTCRFRDLGMLVPIGVQLWMYGSCVVYPLSKIPVQWRWCLLLNPMVPVIEGFRFSFLGVGSVEIWQLALSFAASLVVLLVGIGLFHRAEKISVDTI